MAFQVTDTDFASLRLCFVDRHNVPAFQWLPKVLIDHYNYRMPLNLYRTLFVDGATCVELKPDAYTLLNDCECYTIYIDV